MTSYTAWCARHKLLPELQDNLLAWARALQREEMPRRVRALAIEREARAVFGDETPALIDVIEAVGLLDEWLRVEAIADNDAGGAALKHAGRWYECSRALWQFAAWDEMEFQARDDGTVSGLRALRAHPTPEAKP